MEQSTQEIAEAKVADMMSPEEPAEEVQAAEEPQEEVVEEVEESTEEPTEEPTEESTEEPKPDDGLVEFEWEGQVLESTPEIRDALMRNKDYTEKTQEISLQRKQLEVDQGQVSLQRSQYEFAQSIWDEVQQVQVFAQQVDQHNEYLKTNIDSLSSTEVLKVQMARDEFQSNKDKLIQEIQTKQGNHQQAQEQAKAELLKQGTEVLAQKIPEWNKEVGSKVMQFAMANGEYSAEQLEYASPSDVFHLYRSMKYGELLDGKAAAVKKVQTAPKIKPASRNPMPEDVKSKLNLRKKLKSSKLSSKEKARAIAEDIGERWG